MTAAIAIGIGACMTMVTIHHVMSGNPIPQKSADLYFVQLDSWDPNQPAEEPNEPPDQVTYLDASALLAAGEARRQVASYRSSRVVLPDGDDASPFLASTRSTSADFFAMFDVPFIHGGGWDASGDEAREQVAVLSRRLNDRVFGGEDSVGRRIRLNGDLYRVTGVIDEWLPVPKFYDITNGAFNESEELFIPFSTSIANEIGSSGNTNCWKPVPEGGWESFLNSECVWMQFWVELHGADERAAYASFLDAYAMSQKELGRFPRSLNNRLRNVMDWLGSQNVVDESVRIMLVLAVLFLIVCLLNTIGLLLAKVLRRSGDIGLRRALGASRRAVFTQYIVEAGLIGVSGGILGVGLTWLGLQGIRGLYRGVDFIDNLVRMDWLMVGLAVVLAIVSALAAALYPTWRACAIQPASQLKTL
ncbi:MAG: ABC transporter permease [Woeseiaceae bacterium]|nr:ABC transporter permease [Woeseiaceae bacterium]